MVSWLNHISPVWLVWMTAMLWQSAILIAIVLALDLVLRRFTWPQLRYALWLLVFVKLVLPPDFAMPTSLAVPAVSFIKQHIMAVGTVQVTAPAADMAGTPPAPTPIAASTHLATANKASHPALAVATLSWQSWLMLAWLTGIVLLTLWLSIKLIRLRNSASAVSLPEWFAGALQESADRLSLRRIPAVIVTRQVRCPAVLGALTPLILMPQDRLGSYSRNETANMLIHELAHIKRGDLFVHTIQLVIQVIYWPNILLWLIRRPIHDLRELCCDATVAARLQDATASYRQTLLDTARLLIAESADPGLGLLGLFERPHAIVTRLNYLEKPYRRQTMCKVMTVFVVTAMLLCVLPMSLTKAETTAADTDSSTVTLTSTTGTADGTSTVVETTRLGSRNVVVMSSTGTAAVSAQQNIDPNAVEFRIVPILSRDLLQDEVDAIKDGSSPLWLNHEYAWADVDPNAAIGAGWVTRRGEDGITEVLVSNRPSEMLVPDGSWAIKSVAVNIHAVGTSPDLGLEFDKGASARVGELTRNNIGRAMAILVHGRVVSAPVIREAITERAAITGNFSIEQLNDLMRSMMVRKPVKIEAHVIVAPVAAMERLLKQVGADTSSATPSTGMQSVATIGTTAGVSAGTSAAGMGVVKLADETAARLLAALPNEPNARIIASPTILTFAEESAAFSVNGGADSAREDVLLKMTPHLTRKNSIRLDVQLTLSKTVRDSVKDMRSTSTTMIVPSGTFTVLHIGGMDKSATYLIVKATPQK
jgi:beta-lactamase regulating signal transducer with metallopeptidase domain